MTRKTNKLEIVDPNSENFPDSDSIDAAENLTLEQIVADELLDNIDWKAVNKALLAGIQRKFINWFVSGNPSSMIATNEIEAQAIALMESEEKAA